MRSHVTPVGGGTVSFTTHWSTCACWRYAKKTTASPRMLRPTRHASDPSRARTPSPSGAKTAARHRPRSLRRAPDAVVRASDADETSVIDAKVRADPVRDVLAAHRGTAPRTSRATRRQGVADDFVRATIVREDAPRRTRCYSPPRNTSNAPSGEVRSNSGTGPQP